MKLASVSLLILACLVLGTPAGETPKNPVQVKIIDEKPAQPDEDNSPIDPTQRLRFRQQINFNVFVTDEQNRTLTRVHMPSLSVDGAVNPARNGLGNFEVVGAPLGKSSTGKERIGFKSVYNQGDLKITQTTELVPSKSPGGGKKRQMDNVLVRYEVENKGNKSHDFGLRVVMSPYLGNNPGCLFAAPTEPNKILDGEDLKGNKVPDYVQILQQPDLKNPVSTAHMTFNLGRESEKPGRISLSQYRGVPINQWDIPVGKAMGSSAMVVYWEPKELKAGAKREIAYAIGYGIAGGGAGETRFRLHLGGSFEPGKLFTISAVVEDPFPGQALALELSPGLERVEGKEMQPVAIPVGEQGESMVLWKARVLREGDFSVRVRGSTGGAQTKLIKISAAK